ncbi:MAG TPA: beta-propeller domain-containing protein [Methanomassiliicoccales archaeon]|nr:beta-propeller domain-containing protein [Methanomassiliicoccales archaeon]
MSERRDLAIIALLIAFGLMLSGGFVILAATDDADASGMLPAFRTQHQFQEFVHQSQQSGIWKSYPMEAASSSPGGDSVRHSTTNVQVEGVDEADCVKTDGNFLYMATGGSISIVKAYPPERLSNVTTIDMKQALGLGENYSAWIQGIYLSDQRLVAVVSVIGPYLPYYAGNDSYKVLAPSVWRMPEERTLLSVFSMDGDGTPSLVGTAGVSGYGVTSRLSDGVVYVITQHYLWSFDSAVALPEEWWGADASDVSITDVHYDPGCSDPSSFLNVLALDVGSMGTSLTSILTGYASTVYVSTDAMYLTYQRWNGEGTVSMLESTNATAVGVAVSADSATTTIYKITLDGLRMEAKARGEVPGYLLNQFSMDERDGLLRVATTFSWENQRNAVYVLNGDLAIVGALEDLAPGERIYSCRFSGDMLYLVTFRQVDPLFVIDLSDPTAPKVQGQLEIPGFSSYLHPVGDDKLVGIGMQNGSIKLSLFDVSDPANPKELSSLVVPGWSSSEALWDHKAVTFDPLTGSLIIPVSSWDPYSWNCTSGAYVFVIGHDDISFKGIVAPGPGEYMMRTQFIGDWLYGISDTTIYVNSLIDLSAQAKLVYKEIDYDYMPILMAEGSVAAIGAVR